MNLSKYVEQITTEELDHHSKLESFEWYSKINLELHKIDITIQDQPFIMMLISNINETLKFIGIEAMSLLIKRKSFEIETYFYNEHFLKMVVANYDLE